MVTASNIKFYKSTNTDGGPISSTEVTSNVLNQLIPATTALESETGVIKYVKLFIKNTNATDTAGTPTMGISSFSLGNDRLAVISSSGDSSTITSENLSTKRAYGVAKSIGELNRSTKVMPIEFENPTEGPAIIQAGDKVIFYDAASGARLASATVASCTSTQLTIVEDISAVVVLNNCYVGAVIQLGNLGPLSQTSVWIRQTVPEFSPEQLSNTTRLTFYFDPL